MLSPYPLNPPTYKYPQKSNHHHPHQPTTQTNRPTHHRRIRLSHRGTKQRQDRSALSPRTNSNAPTNVQSANTYQSLTNQMPQSTPNINQHRSESTQPRHNLQHRRQHKHVPHDTSSITNSRNYKGTATITKTHDHSV